MFWAIYVGVLVVAAEGAKLDNTYLPPPPAAKDAGGPEGSLQVPLEPPYIDEYSSNNVQGWQNGGRPGNEKAVDVSLENEDEVVVPALPKGKFISGSYSYTGPDNVLVTVTYKANEKKPAADQEEPAPIEEESDEEDETEEGREYDQTEESDSVEEEEDDSVVPTPSTLPAELTRAFDFHKKKHTQPQPAPELKTSRPKKPIRKNHKKGQQNKHKQDRNPEYNQSGANRYPGGQQSGVNHYPGGQQGAQHHPSGQVSGYHYNNPASSQGLYGAPTIHQGYSYPKHS